MQTIEAKELVGRQVALLERLAKVGSRVVGTAATSWMPGMKQKFDGLRTIAGVDARRQPVARPIGIALESLPDGSLPFSGAVARPKNGRMQYDTIFRYDMSRPMVSGAYGATLSADNGILARRALGLLETMVRFAELAARSPWRARPEDFRHPSLFIPFFPGYEQVDEDKLDGLCEGMNPELVDAYRERLRVELVDRGRMRGMVLVNAAIVPDAAIAEAVSRKRGFEDYTPVLGAPAQNPVVNLTNPARWLMQRHGIEDVASLGQEALDGLVAEFRQASFVGAELSVEEIYDALLNPTMAVGAAAGFPGVATEQLVAAMRRAATPKVGWEATDSELLAAANSPKSPLILSRFAVTQMVAVEDVQLPHPYVGNFLPPLDWEPTPRAARHAA